MAITFAQGGTFTITKNPAYPLAWFTKRLNQSYNQTVDGAIHVYDYGLNQIYGTLYIKNVPKDEIDNATTGLRHCITDHAIFRKNSIVITPPSAVNIGKGDGTAITAFFDGDSLENIFTLTAPGTMYDIEFPYIEDI